MSYPSFLWKEPLCGAAEAADTIPENVFDDLMLTGELKNTTLAYLRKPCSGAEISQRQGLFRLLLADAEFREKLKALGEQIAALGRLVGLHDRAESRTVQTMLFLPSIQHYLALAKAFAELAVYSGRAGEVGTYFAALCAEERFRQAEDECAERMAHRRPELLYTIHGNEITASEGGEMFREKLERMFCEMGVPDAIPNRKAMLSAGESVAAAYAGVYSGFHAACEQFYDRYAGAFLSGDNDLHLTFAYAEEISFLLDTAAYFQRLSEAGYPLTYPTVSGRREVVLNGIVDVSLAKRGLRGDEVVPNDLLMASEVNGERLSFYIVTGANGGGKTTFLRACGLAVLFFLAGCPVAASSARLYPFTAVYTHFPANESFENSGRFVNEANRAEEIIEKTSEDTFVLFNETYSGTDEQKSEQYSRRLADRMYERGVFGMFVTHIHALTGDRIPTLAAVIDETDENRRTYKIRRVGATSSSFAADILEKYHLDQDSLRQRRTGGHHG
ncbi:MAG: hypothetical protein ACI4V1_02325 [Eubacteriales bacterium]